jgi:transposase
MMRAGLYRPVHVKTLRSQKLRVLLTHRKLLQSKAIAIENDLRATLRNFGLKVGTIGPVKYEMRIRELVENLPELAVLVEPLLLVRRVIREQLGILHRRLLAIVRDDDVCRRLMTIPGVGPVVALTYRVTVDVPARFRNSKAVGAVFGLTPSKYQSGENDRTGAISRCGDEMMRMMLYEAAQSMLMRSTKWSWLKAWAMKVARHRGMKKAIVALARRLAVIMHRIWVDGTEFRWRGVGDNHVWRQFCQLCRVGSYASRVTAGPAIPDNEQTIATHSRRAAFFQSQDLRRPKTEPAEPR